MYDYKEGNYRDVYDELGEFLDKNRNTLTGYRQVQIEQRMLDIRLDEIAMEKSQAKYKSRKKFYRTPREALRQLGESSLNRKK